MANLLVFAEARDGRVTAPSRFAVAEARRIAGELGASVYALVTIGPCADDVITGLGQALGTAGADRVLCCSDPGLDRGPLDVWVGAPLLAVSERLRPVLTLFPAGPVGFELGPPLAIRSGAAFFPRAAVEITPISPETGVAPSRVVLRRWRATDGQRAADLRRLEQPVVATLASEALSQELGAPLEEVEMLASMTGPRAGIEELSSRIDEAGDAALAPALLMVPRETAAEPLAALRAAVPEETVVIRDGDVSAPILAAACPGRLLVVGSAARAPRVSPKTRVAVVDGRGAEKGPSPASVLWRGGDNALQALTAALARTRAGGVS